MYPIQPPQVKLLKSRGVDTTDMSYAEANKLITELVRNKWITPLSWKKCRKEGYGRKMIMSDYYEKKAKDSEELVWLSCKVFAVVFAVVAIVAVVKWIIS